LIHTVLAVVVVVAAAAAADDDDGDDSIKKSTIMTTITFNTFCPSCKVYTRNQMPINTSLLALVQCIGLLIHYMPPASVHYMVHFRIPGI
jgi:hypothetical protein